MTRNNWFDRTARGMAWTPITWQGWALVAVLVGVITLSALAVAGSPSPYAVLANAAVTIVTLTAITLVAVVKGPAPQWRLAGQDD